MSQNVRMVTARSGPGPTPPAGPGRDDPDGRTALAGLLRRAHRLAVSKRTALTLILAMGVLSLVGTLIDQAPDEVRGDPQSYAAWVDSVRPKYGGWTDPLKAAGVFGIFSSIWFRAVTVLLAVSVLACTYERTPALWRRATRPRLHVGDSFFDRTGARASAGSGLPPGRLLERMRAELTARRFRTLDDPQRPGEALYADRFRFAPLGTVVSHVALVVILLGVLISSTTGFKDPELTVTVGSRAEVGHGTGLTVEARSFSDTYYENGSPKDYVSELVLYRADRQVASQKVRVNQPLRWQGVSFYQSFHGTAAVMRVTDSAGRVLFGSGVPLRWTSDDGRSSIGSFELPDQRLTVYVGGATSGQVNPDIGAGQVRVEVYRDGADAPVATQVLTQGRASAVAGLTYTFERERKFTGLLVSRDPGAVWVYTGSALLVLGLFCVLAFRHRRVWVLVRPAAEGSELLVVSDERHDVEFASRLRQLVDQVAVLARTPSEDPEKVGQDA